MISDEVENDIGFSGQKRPQIRKESDKLKFAQIMLGRPIESDSCRRVQDPEVSDESTLAEKSRHMQRDGLTENCTSLRSREEHRDGPLDTWNSWNSWNSREGLTEFKHRDGLVVQC